MSETAPAASLKSAYAPSSCSSAARVEAGSCASTAPATHSAANSAQRAPCRRLRRGTLDDLAALDDDCDVLERVNIGQRVGVDGDQVGEAAGRDGADVGAAVERLGGAARG